jgi:hypothetical protein
MFCQHFFGSSQSQNPVKPNVHMLLQPCTAPRTCRVTTRTLPSTQHTASSCIYSYTAAVVFAVCSKSSADNNLSTATCPLCACQSKTGTGGALFRQAPITPATILRGTCACMSGGQLPSLLLNVYRSSALLTPCRASTNVLSTHV